MLGQRRVHAQLTVQCVHIAGEARVTVLGPVYSESRSPDSDTWTLSDVGKSPVPCSPAIVSAPSRNPPCDPYSWVFRSASRSVAPYDAMKTTEMDY